VRPVRVVEAEGFGCFFWVLGVQNNWKRQKKKKKIRIQFSVDKYGLFQYPMMTPISKKCER